MNPEPPAFDPEDPETIMPTLPAEAWADFETALRRRRPDELPPRPSDWTLVVYAGNQLGRVFPLKVGANVMGRSPLADLTLLDEEVSRQHARLWLEAQASGFRLTLEDMDSTNGTYVNGLPLASPMVLNSGDRIALGTHVLKLVSMDPLERLFHETLPSRVSPTEGRPWESSRPASS